MQGEYQTSKYPKCARTHTGARKITKVPFPLRSKSSCHPTAPAFCKHYPPFSFTPKHLHCARISNTKNPTGPAFCRHIPQNPYSAFYSSLYPIARGVSNIKTSKHPKWERRSTHAHRSKIPFPPPLPTKLPSIKIILPHSACIVPTYQTSKTHSACTLQAYPPKSPQQKLWEPLVETPSSLWRCPLTLWGATQSKQSTELCFICTRYLRYLNLSPSYNRSLYIPTGAGAKCHTMGFYSCFPEGFPRNSMSLRSQTGYIALLLIAFFSLQSEKVAAKNAGVEKTHEGCRLKAWAKMATVNLFHCF